MRRLREALNTPRGRTADSFRSERHWRRDAWLSDVAEPIVDQIWDVARVWQDRKEAYRADRRQRKIQQKLARAEERRAQKRARLRGRSRVEGWAQLVAAGALGVLAALHSADLWWLIFPALGVGTQGIRVLASAPSGSTDADARPSGRAKPVPADADPRDDRVDAVCERILAELKGTPESLRDLGSRPEKTIEALRTTCHELSRRERELRRLLAPEDDRRLLLEREQLVARIGAEQDAIVRQRLEGALGALDAQVQQRRELATAAARFDAEHTRLAYTLEGMYTQILRVRSADAASRDVAGAGLRQSVEQLGAEIDAVAEALEAVNRGDVSPISAPEAESEAPAPRGQTLDRG